MKLPEMQYADGMQKYTRSSFAGLNHRPGAQGWEIYDMKNMSSRDYPLLSVRERRRKLTTLGHGNGLYAWDGLIWADEEKLYLDGSPIGAVSNTRKTFAGIGNYVVVLPDKLYVDLNDRSLKQMESVWQGSGVTFGNGTLYGEDAMANMIKLEGVSWADYFKEGDAVEISGCTEHAANNKTPIIREIDGDELHFYEETFELDDSETAVSSVDYVESGTITLQRTVPDMDFIFECDNRLWGCKDNEIYASKLGDIFNWNVFDGLSTDSYATDVGSASKFDGAINYAGYPCFFKEDRIYKMYGDYPSQFQLMGSSTLGMKDGCGESAAIAGEKLIYLSRAGFVSYTGGIPNPISDVFGGENMRYAVGGSDGLRYYCSVKREDGTHGLFCLDTESGTWHIEDDLNVVDFCWYLGNLYALTEAGEIWLLRCPTAAEEMEQEGDIDWFVEFGDVTIDEAVKTNSMARMNTKALHRLQLRMEMAEDAEAQVWIMYDSDGDWLPVGGTLYGTEKHYYLLPVRMKRCDHYRIKITGTNFCRIFSIGQEYTIGSEYRGRRY